jgi:hypothetical protein
VHGILCECKKFHGLLLQALFSFLCQQLLTNWVTCKKVLVLFQSFYSNTVKDHTELAFAVVRTQQTDPATLQALSWLMLSVFLLVGGKTHCALIVVCARNVITWDT